MTAFNKIYLSNCFMYEFNTNNSVLIDNIVEKINSSELISLNKLNHSTLVDNFYDKDLFEWFEDCIRHVTRDLNFSEGLELPITLCWANKTTRLQRHHSHYHANSFMSGVFYLTENHSGGATYFSCSNPWLKNHEWIHYQGLQKELTHSFVPKKGTLILFPSYLPHQVATVKDDNPRYTVAFNTFFSGVIEPSTTSKARLRFSTPSVKGSHET